MLTDPWAVKFGCYFSEKMQDTPMIFMGKSMVSCRFSRENQSMELGRPLQQGLHLGLAFLLNLHG